MPSADAERRIGTKYESHKVKGMLSSSGIAN